MSIYKRGETYWFHFVFDGRHVQASTKVGNAKLARDVERAAWNNLARGDVGLPPEGGPQKNVTVGELLDALKARYAEDKPLSQQRQSTLKLTRSVFGSKVANQLTSKDIENYISEKRREGKANATINRVLEIIRRAFHIAKIAGPEIRHLSEKNNARKGFFEADDFRRLIANLPEDLRDFCRFLWYTSWRKGEVASLKWSDIEGDIVRLRGENSKNGEGRSIVLTPELGAIIDRRKQVRLANGVLTKFVFHREGRPIAEMRKTWAASCVAAGLGHYVCPKCAGEGSKRTCERCKVTGSYVGRLVHDLRRSGVRNMIRSGVAQSIAMKISGHKTASMFRRYDIGSEADLREAMLRVEEYNRAQADKVVTMASGK